ncbi:tail fiber assembly protein [Serratia proteamaculans]|jgi:hypothetical protein|uniref:tail fiber assembly protein n=1 Tax=Serratia proteamaculans TaxID=28151 RepID=UPI00217A7429|nr:tail fiber assembly protein [Serratia proteamaculans]CAI1863479.1 Caudovirales tail fibre assembly protein [Serratia proteamaculans]
MTNYKFSAKTNSFYPESLREYYEEAGTLPTDLIDVTDEVYATFSGQPPEDKVRGSKKGLPAWIDIPPLSKDQAQEHARMKKQQLTDESDAIILPLERAVRLGMATNEEKVRLDAWERYSVLLSRVDVSEGLNIEWPSSPGNS